VVSQAGGVVLVETVRAVGLDRALSVSLAPWRKPMALHDPAKVVCDLAVALALGGDCLADVALLRGEPAVFGLVASDPTVSRTIDALASGAPAALRAVDAAWAAARAVVWSRAGEHVSPTQLSDRVLTLSPEGGLGRDHAMTETELVPRKPDRPPAGKPPLVDRRRLMSCWRRRRPKASGCSARTGCCPR
jgi:hypothetical protein